MARLARFVAPGLPHHVTERGYRREPVFFGNGDQELYRDSSRASAQEAVASGPTA